MCQRHKIGLTAANDGFAAKPPQDLFARAMSFTGEEAETKNGIENTSRDTGGDAEAKAKADHSTDWVQLGLRAVRWLVQSGLAAAKAAGAPTVLTLLGLSLVFMQQREVRRLSAQVDELVEAVTELRDSRSGQAGPAGIHRF